MFVQVKFYQQDASAHNHFVAGQAIEEATNRIIAFVRSSPERTREHFNKLGKQIEDSWYVVVGEKVEGENEEEIKQKEKNRKETPEREKNAKELLSIGFVPGLSGREKGFVVPEAGKEEAWFKEFRKEFEEKADLGDEGFQKMIEEVKTREDLKSWMA